MLKTIRINNISTNLFHLKTPSTTPESPLLIFIPGNPGFISYYTKYLTSIQKKLPIDTEILGISLAGFTQKKNRNSNIASINDEKDLNTWNDDNIISTNDNDNDNENDADFDANNNDKIYTLKEQTQHKIDIIRNHLSVSGSDKTRKVMIFGHSVGGWLIQRIMDGTPEINYQFVGFITPTLINIHKSTKGQILYPISTYLGSKLYETAGLISKLLFNSLPVFFIDFALNSMMNLKDDEFKEKVKQITKEFILTPSFIRQSIGLAAEEMATIQNDWQYEEVWFGKNDGIEKWVFFTSPDNWVHDNTQKELILFFNGYKNVKVSQGGGGAFDHSFCINQSEAFAGITAEVLNASSVVGKSRGED